MSTDPPSAGDPARPSAPGHQPTDGVWPANTYLGLLPERARLALLRAGVEKIFQPGSPLVRQGDHSSYLVLIEKGVVKVTSMTEEGHVSLLAIRAAGDVVGELAAIDGAPRSATVTAAGTVRARVIHRDEFVRLFQQQPEVALALVTVVSGKLRAASRARVDTSGYPLHIRLARTLVELAETYGEPVQRGIDITVPLSQEDLAALISSSPAGLARSLRHLRESGLVDTSYRRLTVLDLAGLSELAALSHSAGG
ncbi:Crp/Fnr family transcriptional regulator [Streptomyces sp. NPDC058861]|uniref:Crp/Fnr family transcriptional regulator n=1 Tax=Streptomyces sp. NPDC058861 TaxID=3346653 RepID=UPI0036A705FA